MKKIDGGTCTHVGILVKSIDEVLNNLSLFVDGVERDDKVYPPEGYGTKELNLRFNEKEVFFESRITAVNIGPMTLELFEPLRGESSWHDMLDEKGMCLHHLYFEVDSINDTIDLFNSQGIKCLQRGQAKNGLTWAYFDTIDKLGYHIEVKNTDTNEILDESKLKY